MRILVTGGAGFIGSNLVRRLVTSGESVCVIDDLSTGFRDNIAGLPIDFVHGSVLNEASLAQAIEGAEAVVHLAALGSVPRSISNPVASHQANASGSLAVLEAARAIEAYVVAASSSSVYGSVPGLPRTEELPTRPMSPYAASKLATEAYVLAYGQSYGLETLPFRFFNVFGPRQSAGHAYAAVIPTFIDSALKGMPLPVDGDGRQTRDFTYVDIVTWVLQDAVSRRVTCDRPVNLAMGIRISLLDLVEELQHALGRPLQVKRRPPRVGDVRASQSSPVLLGELFPDIPDMPFRDGLIATVEWFRATASNR